MLFQAANVSKMQAGSGCSAGKTIPYYFEGYNYHTGLNFHKLGYKPISIHLYIYVYIYAHTHTYIHTYIYIYTYIYAGYMACIYWHLELQYQDSWWLRCPRSHSWTMLDKAVRGGRLFSMMWKGKATKGLYVCPVLDGLIWGNVNRKHRNTADFISFYSFFLSIYSFPMYQFNYSQWFIGVPATSRHLSRRSAQVLGEPQGLRGARHLRGGVQLLFCDVLHTLKHEQGQLQWIWKGLVTAATSVSWLKSSDSWCAHGS